MGAAGYYATVLLVYLGTDLLAAWGMNLEFGVAGVANLAYIVVIAAGAYTYAVFALPRATANGGFQQYILGLHQSFAVSVLAAAVVGALAGILIGLTGLKRLRQDYQAMVMLVVSLIAATVIGADTGFLNGDIGLSLIPNPFANLAPTTASWAYVALVALACLVGLVVMRRFTTGPLGRTLRAMRDDEHAVAAAGHSVVNLRLVVQAVGGAFGGVSGALLVAFIGGWSPGAWAYAETLAILTAVIVGGMGNTAGVSAGAFVVYLLLLQGVQFLPQFAAHPGLSEDLGWMVLGGLTIAFIWLRPQGIFPERRPRLGIARFATAGAPPPREEAGLGGAAAPPGP